MNEKGELCLVELVRIIFSIISVFTLVIAITMALNMDNYKTDTITVCEDRTGNIIDDVVCYESVTCSTKFKIFNPSECEKYMKAEEGVGEK